ncbi:MAG: hypothetical protein Q8K36_04935 [Alphaproteobacteria bacterium]|nr:hypothetical protein [Alphaproteobacteria bacterium]
MSNFGCFIIVKEGVPQIIWDKYLAIDSIFIFDLTLGLKHTEESVRRFQESENSTLTSLNEFCSDGFCYLEGAILINYDTKHIHFYDAGLLSPQSITFIQDSCKVLESYNGWSIVYEKQGFKKIAEMIGQSMDYQDEQAESNEGFLEDEDGMMNVQGYITDLICPFWSQTAQDLAKILLNMPQPEELTFMQRLLCKLGCSKTPKSPEIDRILLGQSIIKPENKTIVHDYIKANAEQYHQGGYNVDDIIRLHERIIVN